MITLKAGDWQTSLLILRHSMVGRSVVETVEYNKTILPDLNVGGNAKKTQKPKLDSNLSVC